MSDCCLRINYNTGHTECQNPDGVEELSERELLDAIHEELTNETYTILLRQKKVLQQIDKTLEQISETLNSIDATTDLSRIENILEQILEVLNRQECSSSADYTGNGDDRRPPGRSAKKYKKGGSHVRVQP